MSFIIWFISSIIMLLGLRSFFMKYFEGKTRVQNTDEDIDAYGQNATVVESINPSKSGRIHFRGTTWSARSEVSIDKDEAVIVIGRDSNTWVVKKINQ
jgi:membrane protein implicated in regulation of membrane protease activity